MRLPIGTEVISTWSPSIRGTIIGYGSLSMDGRPRNDESGRIEADVVPVYLVDLGRNRMFDLNREPPGPAGARVLCLQMDRVYDVG